MATSAKAGRNAGNDKGERNGAASGAIAKGETNLNQSLAKLNEIVTWFEDQTDMDVEKGLQNVKEGVGLIKACKARLAEIENEFVEIQREISDDVGKPGLKGKGAKATESLSFGNGLIEEEIDPKDLPF